MQVKSWHLKPIVLKKPQKTKKYLTQANKQTKNPKKSKHRKDAASWTLTCVVKNVRRWFFLKKKSGLVQDNLKLMG